MAAHVRILVPLLCCLCTAGCGDGPANDVNLTSPASITVTSTAFSDGGDIPVRFTCDGEGISPPVAWASRSKDPRSWALVVDDPDAPGGTFVHWVVLDIAPATRSIAPGAAPLGAVQAVNSAHRVGYTAPCPPSGKHRYRFSVYGLSGRSGLADGVALNDALDAIRAAAVNHGTLVGTYQRDRGP